MASKYDGFWHERLDEIASLIELAAEGRSPELDVIGLQRLGQRASWYGSAVVRNEDCEAVMAHMVAFAKLIVDAGLCGRWPALQFRFTVKESCRLSVTAAGATATSQGLGARSSPKVSEATMPLVSAADAALACAEIHRLVEQLPLLESPAEVAFANGLYFFYETGEASEHAPAGRIVRVGNHPRAQGRLKARLGDHYRTRDGAKNGSVFRRYLGGALMRRDHPASGCLLPRPGAGHWEHQGGAACEGCAHYEDLVTGHLRGSFRFRCLRIDDMGERNRFEARLIATIAACPICRSSPTWLGRHAYSCAVQNSGVWNSDFVGGPALDERDLQRLQELVANSRHRSSADLNDEDLSDTLLILPCCQSKRGQGSVDLPPRSIVDFLSPDVAETLVTGRVAAFERAGTSIDLASARQPALRLYTGQPYKTPGLRDSLVSLVKSGLHCVIVSGGYGLVRPEEPIHYYEAQIQRTAPVWRRRIPLLLAEYVERQRIQRSFGAFSRQYGNVVPTHLTGNDWRAVPVFRRGDEGSAYHEAPRRVGSAVMRLIDARFEPGRAEDGAAPWLPT